MLEKVLSPVELRVLGSLIEKEATTPEYYPMTLNALVAACNQKSNRWPTTNYSETDIVEGVRELRTRRYAAEITGAGMRVAKYAQRFTETLNLGRRETAVLCVLALRGPQTLAEIRDRSERLHRFDDLETLEGVLRKLSEMDMVAQLDRMPGQKEPRFVQLLGGPVEAQQPNSEGSQTSQDASMFTRLRDLEGEVAALRLELDELKRRLDAVLG